MLNKLIFVGNFGRLASPETVVPEPVDTKAIEVSLEDARLGRVIGKNGVHIKALCKAYNVTARVTKPGGDERGRQRRIYDENVLVLVSSPVGHDQDILKFEKALIEHVSIVKKKEKKHKAQVCVSV